MDELTGREQDALAQLARGLGTAAIGMQLGVKPATVRVYLRNAMAKLGVHRRQQAAALALERGLVHLGGSPYGGGSSGLGDRD